MSVGKSEGKDRFIVTRLPGNAAEQTCTFRAFGSQNHSSSRHVQFFPERVAHSHEEDGSGRDAAALVPKGFTPEASVPAHLYQLRVPVEMTWRSRAMLGPDGGMMVSLPRVDRLCRILLHPGQILERFEKLLSWLEGF